MDLRQLAYAVAVADEGGFTAAARSMSVAQPSLSQSIRALERELGVDLFHRTTRSVRLTAAGEALIGPARWALRDAAAARDAVAAVRGLRSGRLDIVCLPTLAVAPLSELVGRFRAMHPGVTVRVREPADAEAATDAVRQAAAEVGLVELVEPGRPAAGLASVSLGAQEYVALVPPDVAEALSARHATVADLAHLPLIAPPRGTSSRRVIDEAFEAVGRHPSIAVETDHREAIASLVEAGAGVALVPRAVAVRAASPAAVVVELEPRLSRRIGLIFRPDGLSPAARAFLAIAEPGRPAGPRGGTPTQ